MKFGTDKLFPESFDRFQQAVTNCVYLHFYNRGMPCGVCLYFFAGCDDCVLETMFRVGDDYTVCGWVVLCNTG